LNDSSTKNNANNKETKYFSFHRALECLSSSENDSFDYVIYLLGLFYLHEAMLQRWAKVSNYSWLLIIMMVLVRKYKVMSKFVTVMPGILYCRLFFRTRRVQS